MLNLQSIAKKYGKRQVLVDINLSVQPGEIIGLVGENGAGKTTLLQMIATLLKPTSGEISIDGLSYATNLNAVRRKIGFVPQEISLWEHLTVEENMVFFEKLSWKQQSRKQLRQLCQEMNLVEWKEPVHTLSGGTKRKLNLAISLIHEPKLLLLDEPTVGIDLKSKQEIIAYLQWLAREKQVTIFYISHNMDEIMNLCHYTYCLGEDPFYEKFLIEQGQRVYLLK